MRQLTDHIVSGDQAVQLTIEVTDAPGQGGANHKYEIRKGPGHGADFPLLCEVNFQDGPIKESGVNGVTQEALLAIVIDRLRSFQAGEFACEDNAVALAHCTAALVALQQRTIRRIARGVEGTNRK
jgi:hypothetical protein